MWCVSNYGLYFSIPSRSHKNGPETGLEHTALMGSLLSPLTAGRI